MAEKKPYEPERIFCEYRSGINYKNSLGTRGMYEQDRLNERMYVGDQWHGAKVGNRPLARYNVIKRIGEYKTAVLTASPVSVTYSAEGVASTIEMRKRARQVRQGVAEWQTDDPMGDIGRMGEQSGEEIVLVMSALSDYWKVTAERVKFDELKTRALKRAYRTGTGILYTYWDENVQTGLYADNGRKTPIKGDIQCEVLDIENVYFGDTAEPDVQCQPYIIIAQRKSVGELRRTARKNRRPDAEIDSIRPDRETQYMAGALADKEQEEAQKATVLTKLWKEWNEDGTAYTIRAVQVTEKATVRKAWDLGVRLYPLAKFVWEERDNCAYGESEITYLIPNQIAINRMLSANVWALMLKGMPITVVNRNIVQQPVTNDPGLIINVDGDPAQIGQAVYYVKPPEFAAQLENNITSLMNNTLSTSGANDAALGDMRPDNTSAIIAVREAATMPLQVVQNAFYAFIEDVARIWAEFWVQKYGDRALKVEDDLGTWYMPFSGERYKDVLISCKIDVGASTLWSEAAAIRTLDGLLEAGIINAKEYLERMPRGMIKDVTPIIDRLERESAPPQGAEPGADMPPAVQMPPVPAPEENPFVQSTAIPEEPPVAQTPEVIPTV